MHPARYKEGESVAALLPEDDSKPDCCVSNQSNLTRAPPLFTDAFSIDSFVRELECERITGLSRSTRWRLERAGRFPKRRRLSSGAIGWLRSELSQWVASRQAA
jgi:prophage regulatory protein